MTTARTVVSAIALAGLLTGCSEFQARQHARQGNAHFREGNYTAAVEEYRKAEARYPGLAVVALNLGLACRQLMIPGGKGLEQDQAADCALDAFQRLRELAPNDARGDQLYLQTLFDADRFDELTKRYEEQLRQRADDLTAINGLIQVNSRAGRYKEELRWTARQADVKRDDAAAQYAVGVFVWDLLFQKGGGGEIAKFDPRPDPGFDEPKSPPEFAEGDIVGKDRVELADEGIKYLKRALKIRPKYREAMVYLNLLLRQKSFAFFDRPNRWFALLTEADEWRKKAQETKPTAPSSEGGAR